MRGFGLPGLRQRRDRADLGEAEAEAQQRVRHLGVLVVAGGHAERIGEVEAADADPQPCRRAAVVAAHRQAAFQARRSTGRARFPDRMRTAASGRAARARSFALQRRKFVPAVSAERQRPHPVDGRQVAADRRDAGTARRRARPRISVHRPARPPSTATSSRPVWPAKCLAAVSLTCSAVEKWMKPSATIDRRAVKRPIAFGLAPQRFGSDLVDNLRHGCAIVRTRPGGERVRQGPSPFPAQTCGRVCAYWLDGGQHALCSTS